MNQSADLSGAGVMMSVGPPHEQQQQQGALAKNRARYTDWREFAAGYGAGVMNIMITFPINKTMFRQQLHGIRALEAVSQLRHEGLFSLYRGILPPLIQKSVTTSVMFGTYFQYQRILRESFGFRDTSSQVVAAILAGCTEAALTPLERIQTLLLDHNYGKQFKNTPHAMLSLRAYGLREYYRGLTAVLLRNGPSNVIFFSCRDRLRALVPESPRWSFLGDFVAGACLGAFISTVFFPVNTTKTHMQKVCGEKFRSFGHVFLGLYRERGLRGMFRGVHVNYTRSFLSWGIVNVTYEFISKQLLSPR